MSFLYTMSLRSTMINYTRAQGHQAICRPTKRSEKSQKRPIRPVLGLEEQFVSPKMGSAMPVRMPTQPQNSIQDHTIVPNQWFCMENKWIQVVSARF